MQTNTQRNHIDVDVGGTFTDVVLSLDGQLTYRKVPTTQYDLSVCFIQAVTESARAVGLSPDSLLDQIDLIRYSTTVAMNRLLERKGPRIGLITTEGHEDAVLIGRGAQWIDGTRVEERRAVPMQRKPLPLVPREMIVGIKERVDSQGRVLRPLDENDVRGKVRSLVDKGARAFVVSLLWSFRDPQHELRVRDIIREEYREYHVGYVPVILSHQVVSRVGEYERTNTAILDAYLQRSMQLEISSTWDKLRELGYRGPFNMVHNTGGCADIFKTTASRTYNGGPVAGLIGAHRLARALGVRNVVTSDVGGTSFDIGLIVESDVRNYEFNPIVDRWMVGITMVECTSIGAGGGSIARLNPTLGNTLAVGPQSAGSYPGPACYNLGGTEPTVTDADLVLGYLNPEFYFGGRMRLNPDLAEAAIRDKVAGPLGLDAVGAAALIRRVVDAKMASAIRKEVVLRGYRPADFVLFAFGGGGPTHAAGYRAGIPRVITFPFSPVFCAYGSSIMDLLHVHETSHRLQLIEPVSNRPTRDYAAFNAVVQQLLTQTQAELAAEGVPLDQVIYSLELDMLYGGQVNSKRTSTPGLFLKSEDDVWRLYRRFEQEFSEAFSPLIVNLPGGVFIDTFVLRAALPSQPVKLPEFELSGASPTHAQKGTRTAFWPEVGKHLETPVFDHDRLRPGHRLSGPALIESDYTTGVIPPGHRFRIDTHGLGIFEPVD